MGHVAWALLGMAFYSTVTLGEPATAKKIAGLALCVAGVYLVAS